MAVSDSSGNLFSTVTNVPKVPNATFGTILATFDTGLFLGVVELPESSFSSVSPVLDAGDKPNERAKSTNSDKSADGFCGDWLFPPPKSMILMLSIRSIGFAMAANILSKANPSLPRPFSKIMGSSLAIVSSRNKSLLLLSKVFNARAIFSSASAIARTFCLSPSTSANKCCLNASSSICSNFSFIFAETSSEIAFASASHFASSKRVVNSKDSFNLFCSATTTSDSACFCL
ncbi:Uncharacterised protein [Candidatus Venteria ishoeyi]|uniref:Uncharacterized protein n=1 Tax=Candidatus Venteria ishoeyi TaxID=1899563 RepID=A0A1H6F8M4_9GAMM|nr:Uncharacterised protein [Candidatus Venteria ishoeyi]